MKRVVLLIISALICGVMFLSSCNKDEVNSALSMYASVPSTTKSTSVEESEGNKVLWCTGNDIEWNNGTTGELKLKKLENEDLPVGALIVYLGEEKLFVLGAAFGFSSIDLHYPVLINDRDIYYISKGYPMWGPAERELMVNTPWEQIDEEREKNWKAIEPGWNKFIEQLKKEGKYRK